MNEHRHNTITAPSRGNTRALAVSGTQANFDLSAEALFGDEHANGQYYSASCNQIWYFQLSAGEADTINITESVADDSDVGEDHDRHAGGPFAANTPVRFLLTKNSAGALEKHLHVIAAAGGILRVWRSSSSRV